MVPDITLEIVENLEWFVKLHDYNYIIQQPTRLIIENNAVMLTGVKERCTQRSSSTALLSAALF